jgi:hypothetical protein
VPEYTPTHRHPHLGSILFGLAAFAASAYVLTDGTVWLPGFDWRWLLAGGAVLAGVLMLIGSLRNRS